MPRFNRGGSENGERAGVERRRGEEKENVEGMTEERGRKEGMGNSDGGNCATAPRGDRRHCTGPFTVVLCSTWSEFSRTGVYVQIRPWFITRWIQRLLKFVHSLTSIHTTQEQQVSLH